MCSLFILIVADGGECPDCAGAWCSCDSDLL